MLPKGNFSRCLAFAGLSLFFASAVEAAPSSSPVGTANVTVADPTVPRPPGKPCVVQLFSNDTFDDFNTRPFSYTPPAGCGTHWSKVVLEADFSVTAGVQFDRTGTIFLGGVNLFFGTTQEPTSTLAPSWHVERDLTDYSALFRKAGQGQADIGNIVDSTYTGVINGSARLLFYPASIVAPAAKVPDAVYPLGSDPVGSTVLLDSSANAMTTTLTLPRNVERAYLDVFTQGQSTPDEFWYTCVPDQYASQTGECGGGNFREAEISVDGQPAGVAPVYPWIFTGGADLFIWKPTPGVQTLNFVPYRVDLTPFAGLLSNGSPHQVTLTLAGANNYFMATGALLVYEDPHASRVSGQVVSNTLANQPATPTVGSTLSTDSSGNTTGNVTTNLSRHFVIKGYVNTSHGRVDTTVDQTVSFANTEIFDITSTIYDQTSKQLTSVEGVSTSKTGAFISGQFRQSFSYPLYMESDETVTGSAGDLTVFTNIRQGFDEHTALSIDGFPLYAADVHNHHEGSDSIVYSPDFAILSHSGQNSKQDFTFGDSLGGCYRASVSAANDVVTAYSSGNACPGRQNRVFWFTEPDGAPYQGEGFLGW